ncbi:hypothetical protein MOQ_000627 [Trypanosoma cruzi marinkellei]|uniref:Uncharacterized protein n=1 Tax=Trypanosoma cruzi marinkellei TaxID=85056 RepID=K2NIF5_TRYCR|nr:hypothetical protein MOQ_000627 [Trypanosoma cruzi marinkellei]
MIPKLNINSIVEMSGKARDQNASGSNRMEAMRTPQEMLSSTPLRVRSTVKSVPRIPHDGSPTHSWRSGATTKFEESGSGFDLPRRAEELSYVLGGNILQIQDVQTLQLRAVEMAERLLRMEEWYKEQLHERSSYLEHRLMQLTASTVGGCSRPISPPIDRLVAPAIIRSRQVASSATTGLSRPTLNVGAVASIRQNAVPAAPNTPNTGAANSRTPDSSRHLIHHRTTTPVRDPPFSSQSAALRHTPISRRPNKDGGLNSGGRSKGSGMERRKLRSTSLTISRGSRGSSDAGIEEIVDDLSRRRKKRRSLASPLLVAVPVTNNTPRRQRPPSGRLGHTS